MMPPLLLQEQDPRFELRPSTIPGAGLGCFARVPLRKGDRLEVVGVFLEPGSVADRCTAYADAYKFRCGRWLLLPVGLAAMVNHSPTPNLHKVEQGSSWFLEALHDIAAGDELFFTYSVFAQERFLS